MTDEIKINPNEALKLHIAGATVQHRENFSNLKILTNNEPLSYEFYQKYVVPFYLTSTTTPEYRTA